MGKILLQCEESYRVTSPQIRQEGAVFKAWAQVGTDRSLNPASAACDLCKPVAIPSLSFLLCMGRNHDVALVWLDGSVYVACFMQCLNHSRLYTFWQLKKKRGKNLKGLWDWRFQSAASTDPNTYRKREGWAVSGRQDRGWCSDGVSRRCQALE